MGTIADAAQAFIGLALNCLNMDLTTFVSYFPVAATLYVILQSVAIGFLFAFAAWNLGKFLTGHLANLTESPVQIIVMSGMSAFLIFFGNYILQTVINVFSYPYADILAVDATHNSFSFETIQEATTTSALALIAPGASTAVAAVGIVLIIIIILLGYQILALLFEMIERWIMLGVLVYTSPLAWATIVSSNTRPMFQKWLNMFLSQCLLLLINAWSVKMLFSIMSYPDAGVMSIALALCFCKVARQLDTYLKQIGLNPAGTGRSLLDDIRSAAHSVFVASRLAGGGSTRSSDATLGSSTQMSAASTAAQRVAAHNAMGPLGRGLDNVMHAPSRIKDSFSVLRAGYNGTLTEEGIGGAHGLGVAGKHLFGMSSKSNHIAGVKQPVSPALAAKSQSRLDNMMGRELGVQVSGTGSRAQLVGQKGAMTGAIAQFGNDAFVAGDKNATAAMTNAVRKMNGTEIGQIMEDSTFLQNQDVTVAMAESLAAGSDLATEIGAENVAELTEAVNHDTELSAEDREAVLMSQLGTADAQVSAEQAKANFDRLNEKYGRDSGDGNYSLLSTGDLSDMNYADLADGHVKAETLAAAKDYMGQAHQERELADNAEAQAEALLNGRNDLSALSYADRRSYNELMQTASQHRIDADSHEKDALAFAEEAFGITGKSYEDALAEVNAATEMKGDMSLAHDAFSDMASNVSADNMTPDYIETQLNDVKAHYDELMSAGRYEDAADYSMKKTGTLNPRNLTVDDVEWMDNTVGYRTLDDMAYGTNRTSGTWSQVTSDGGTLRGIYSSVSYGRMDDGQYGSFSSERAVTYATESTARENTGSYGSSSGYTKTKVGEATYVRKVGRTERKATVNSNPTVIEKHGTGKAK